MLNPVWLNTFKTLVDIGHFTKTAEKLFMTQPGVSQHIRKLEQSCGHSLLKRENKSFELTEAGRLLYQYTIEQQQNEAALLDSFSFDDPHRGEYRIACSGSIALPLYPHLLSLQSQHPKLVIRLEAAPNYKILNDIQEGNVDVGIVTHVPNPSLFDTSVIGQEPLCLFIPRDTVHQSTPLETLCQLGLIHHPDAEHYLSLYLSQSSDPGLASLQLKDIPVSGYVNQINQILIPVAQGLGFTVLPHSAISSFSDADKITLFPSDADVYETLYLVKKRNRSLPARFDFVNQYLGEFLFPCD
ncbi:LysR family transcriptional regulator [Vibrio sp.]|uniref:LysR family transcriptional regulator n=1 Tax=Vibrio sp. TaxID=678 RepID=UPI003D0B078E